MSFNILLILLAVVLYAFSPRVYSEPIILANTAIFIIGTYNLFRKQKESFNVCSFNVIFLFSFFFCTYSYALFVIGAGVEFSMTIFSFTNFDYITRAVGLATIAITMYFCAYSYQLSKRPIQQDILKKTNLKNLIFIKKIRFLLFIGVIANYFYYIMIKGGNASAITSAAYLPELYKEFLILSLLLTKIKFKSERITIIKVISHNKMTVFEAFVLCLLYIIGGDRGLPISIVFIYLGVYSFYYLRIKIIHFVIIATIGLLSLFALRVTRGGENSLSESGISTVVATTQGALSGQSLILLFSDLMGASTEMCLGYEYTQKNGLSTPGKLILVPLQPFPFIPSAVGKLIWEKVPYEMSAGHLLNQYVSNRYGYSASLGNHIVIDLYMHWGIIGIIILFAIFGRCVCYIEQNKYSNIFLASAFIIILSFALYLPRDSIFTLLRPIVFLYFFVNYFKLNIKTKKC